MVKIKEELRDGKEDDRIILSVKKINKKFNMCIILESKRAFI